MTPSSSQTQWSFEDVKGKAIYLVDYETLEAITLFVPRFVDEVHKTRSELSH